MSSQFLLQSYFSEPDNVVQQFCSLGGFGHTDAFTFRSNGALVSLVALTQVRASYVVVND